MPYVELLLHLLSQGDAVVSKNDGRLRTELGHEYIRSTEGRVLTHEPLAWTNKYIWSRV